MSDELEQQLARDRLTFYGNWYEAIRYLPDGERLAWLDAVLGYAFLGSVPKPGNIGYIAVQMVKASIEVSDTRRANGKQNRSKRKAKRKQTESKRGANAEQVQEQVKEQEQVQEQYATTTARGAESSPSLAQFVDGCKLAGVPEAFAAKLFGDLASVAWTDENGRHITNWRRYAKSAWNDSQREAREIAGASASDDPGCRKVEIS